VHGELILGHTDGPVVAHVHVPLLVDLPELGEVLRRGRGVQEPCGAATIRPGLRDPAVDGDVIGMERDPVGPEGQDGVGPDDIEQPAGPREPGLFVVGERAVGQTVDVVLVDAEDAHGRGRLPAADLSEP
jgi:hypothetical protein